MKRYTEDSFIGQLAIKIFKSLGCKNANLRKTRDLLLPKLISGEIDVEEMDIKVIDEVAA